MNLRRENLPRSEAFKHQQPQMASQDFDHAEQGSDSAPGTPGSQVDQEVVNSSVYQLLDRSQSNQMAKLQILGFISSGSISVAAGRKPTRMLMQNSFGMNIASATMALVGFIFLSINIAVYNQSFKSCHSTPSPELCNYLGFSSNGVVSLMLILSLLELCVTISISVMWCQTSSCITDEANSSAPIAVGSGLPPSEGKPEHEDTQPHISSE
ncbi:membrane-spanning 4-domains subfamily A member 3 isoform X2 [Erinaceus europaeus]|uniref:Membrane-spanning 4-domains subfamily A member 3 isoform X2 n=1 Tax=Erinaceus europaeus TaxID=9365 RepID=A0ABM3WA44_ERIEU|nr:membrane-spanning 4-domains subfamily A member 3 isoform X2 [Erinaceus europaeus]